jgi:hypothetical protein
VWGAQKKIPRYVREIPRYARMLEKKKQVPRFARVPRVPRAALGMTRRSVR